MPKVPKPKKSSRKQLIKTLDKKMREYVLLRDKKCVVCGKGGVLQNGHLITRGKHSVRWDEHNCNCQCAGCNLRHEYQPEHYTAWFIRKYGSNPYQALVQRSNTPHKWTVEELEQQLHLIQVRINQLGQTC